MTINSKETPCFRSRVKVPTPAPSLQLWSKTTERATFQSSSPPNRGVTIGDHQARRWLKSTPTPPNSPMNQTGVLHSTMPHHFGGGWWGGPVALFPTTEKPPAWSSKTCVSERHLFTISQTLKHRLVWISSCQFDQKGVLIDQTLFPNHSAWLIAFKPLSGMVLFFKHNGLQKNGCPSCLSSCTVNNITNW